MVETELNSEAVQTRFNKLIQEMLRGTIKRNCFRPWEIELLLDIESCNLRGSNRRETLRRYQKAVQRQMDKGSPMPMRMSEYLSRRGARGRKPAPRPDEAPSGSARLAPRNGRVTG